MAGKLNISTTIDRKVEKSALNSVLKSTAVLGSLLSLWFGTMIAMMLLFDVSKNALVIGNPSTVLSKLDGDARIVRINQNSLVLNSSKPGFTKSLYSSGALVVLPALNSGCLDLSEKWFTSKT
ncbi:MAG: hypothetical protein AAGA53_14865 [Pseudomonadota bacterium]